MIRIHVRMVWDFPHLHGLARVELRLERGAVGEADAQLDERGELEKKERLECL